MAFTYDLSTTVGKIRLTLADTDASAYSFEDAELTHFYAEEGTVVLASIAALKVLLVDRARRVRRFSVTGLSLDDTAQVQAIQAAISMLGGDLPTASARFDSHPTDRSFDWTDTLVS